MKNLYILLTVLLVFNCKNETKDKTNSVEIKSMTANEIVSKSIEVSGGANFENSVIQFDFRAIFYKAKRNQGQFELSRLQIEKEDSIFDVLIIQVLKDWLIMKR
jgi:hypothetical protein